MDAIVGVWVTSLLGAAAFSAAGYVLGQRGVTIPLLGLHAPARPDETPASDEATRATDGAPSAKRALPPPSTDTMETPLAVTVTPASGAPTNAAEADDEERPTLVPDTKTQAAVVAAAAATIPPPRAPSIPMSTLAPAVTTAELEAALAKAETATARARAAEAVKSELERQITALRNDHRNELVARATAAARADELGDRLASASEECASLRHKVALLDKQTKQLREALQGRVRALTTSEWHRRRDLEETEEMRVKLRDVYDQLERSSMPPSASAPAPAASVAPGSPPSPATSDDSTELHEELARLSRENRDLRARALGSLPPQQSSRFDAEDVDVDAYRELIARVSDVDGLEGAVLADEMGSLLVGAGELAEGMAAFGAYIRDASARTERLLPLEGVEEVDIRDRQGRRLSTRVVAHAPAELCLVVLGSSEASLATAKAVVDEHLRLRRA
ncbi:MAG: hypothetical protein KF894_10760 [Labilithrix sp.]|nr:hypothetical protein [Labilithrix sp.]